MDYTTPEASAYGTSTQFGAETTPQAFSCATFKKLAKQHLAGKWGAFIGCSIALGLVSFAAGFVPIVRGLAGILLAGVTAMGPVAIVLAVVHGQKPTMSDAFYGFNSYGRNLGAALLMGLYLSLWSLLLFIPGIIKTFSYSATFFLLHENPEMGANEAITMSRKLMDGHKMEAFILGLSFIGWWLLVIVTFGLAAFYVGPYLSVTMGEFYAKLIDDYKANASHLAS